MTKVDITWNSYIRFFAVILGLTFLYFVRDIVFLLFLVVILVAGLSPIVDKLSRYLTRIGAVIAVFITILLVIVLIGSLIIPPVIDQLRTLANNLPDYTQKITTYISDGKNLESVSSWVANNINTFTSRLSDVGGYIFTGTVGVINGLVAIITIMIITFYLLIQEKGLDKIFKGILPSRNHLAMTETLQKISNKLGAWLGGQLKLMLVVGILDTIGLLIIGSPYALTLGLWAGLTEAIPIVGPWIGAIAGIALNFAVSPLQGILAAVIYLVVQQLENSVLVPRIMGKAVGLNPVMVILAVLIGGKLYGLFGIILAVPTAAVISVIVADWSLLANTFKGKKSAED